MSVQVKEIGLKDVELVAQPIRLPNGRVVPNRLSKAALNENLANWGGGPPDERYVGLYRLWAQGDWGVILTGNVQISKTHLALGRDAVLPEVLTDETIAPFKRVADVVHESASSSSSQASPIFLMQLNHTGRQSPRIFGGRSFFSQPIGASTIPMKVRAKNQKLFGRPLFALFFNAPRAATELEIQDVIDGFVRGAELALRSGFDGIQLHCSHGYLLAQFMSPKTNTRPPPYGPPSSLYLLRVIISRIRHAVPPSFVLAVKLNASDYVQGGLSEEDALDQVRMIAELKTDGGRTSVDIIEVSGGDYENPVMSSTLSARQAFFATFSRKALEAMNEIANPPRVMLTGGFTSLSLVAESIREGHADLAGIGRASIADPLLPLRIFSSMSTSSPSLSTSTPASAAINLNAHLPKLLDSFSVEEPAHPSWTPPLALASASLETAQWTSVLQRRGIFGATELRTRSVSVKDEKGSVMPMPWSHVSGLRAMVELVIPLGMLDTMLWCCKIVARLSILGPGIWFILLYLR